MDQINELFDHTFRRKLKAFYSFDEGNRRDGPMHSGHHGYRRTGRTTLLARVLLETAIESGNTLEVNDHHCIAGRAQHANRHLADAIREVAHSYKGLGLEVDLRFDHGEGTFQARIINYGGSFGDMVYSNIRINPAERPNRDFPVQRSKQVSNRKLLLLLQ